MNKDDLKAKLEAQRQWREGKGSKPAQIKPKRSFSMTQTTLFLLVVAGSMYVIWSLTKLPNATVEPMTPPVTAEIAILEQPQTGNMTICAGFDQAKVHVRFGAGLGSDVRGYLSEGEIVTFPLDPYGHAITKEADGVRWAHIESPIRGWVSTSYLCK
jgi:hypothetical protein